MSSQVKRWGWLSFGRCVGIVGTRQRAKLGPNTYLEKVTADEYRVTFHGNLIMRLTADGAIRLYNSGHQRATTKQRLCALSPRMVYQKNYEWFIGPVPFEEGINVGLPQTPREAIMVDVWDGKLPPSVLADYDTDHVSAAGSRAG